MRALNNPIAVAIVALATAVLPVVGKEMEVVSGDTEGAGKAGRPQADQRAGHVRELKFALRFRRVDETLAFSRRIHGPGSDTDEPAVQPEGIENIAR